MTNEKPLLGYKAFFNGREADIRATSLLDAKERAAAHFKPAKSKRHMVSVVLCERADGSAVTHSTAAFS